jgi:hypothetical protein
MISLSLHEPLFAIIFLCKAIFNENRNEPCIHHTYKVAVINGDANIKDEIICLGMQNQSNKFARGSRKLVDASIKLAHLYTYP